MDENKFILITGTSSGLGFNMAQMLLEQGHTVIGLSRRGTDLNSPNFIDIVCDIREEESVEEVYALIANHTDHLDAIILNAGIFEIAPLNETSSKEFLDHFNTNVLGAFHTLKHAQEFIGEEEQTHIITISSIGGKFGLSNMSAYSASKFALNGMIDSLRSEWAHLNVRFTTMIPGAIETPIWDDREDAPRNQMLNVDDFLYVFNMVINSPENIQFPDITFLHKDGQLR
jgi:3-oxoacyl-[acyl-carrier protein] reductase